MSTPRTLRLPEHVVPVTLATDRGTFAALATEPEDVPRAHVVLVPGWTGSKEDFAPLLPLLRAAGYSATAYDQRGQLETTGLPEDDYTLAGFAEDAVAVAASAGAGPVHLLGHSFGGLVAQTAAAAQPDAWRSLSLLCTGPGALGEDPDRPLSHLVEVLDRDSLEEVYGQLQAARGREEQPADVEEFTRRKFVSNAVASLRAMTVHLLEAPDLVEAAQNSGLPVWVARGADDDAWPFDVQDEMARRYGTTVHVVPDSAHSPAIENPDALAAAWLPFLADH